MEQEKPKDVTTKKSLSAATKLTVPRATSIRETKKKLANGFYSRPSVLNKVAQRLLETLQLSTTHSNNPDKDSPSDPPQSSVPSLPEETPPES